MDNNRQPLSYTCIEGDYCEPIVLHLKELRNRLISILFIMFIFVVIFYPFSSNVIQYFWHIFLGSNTQMTVYSPLEWIYSRIEISLLLGFALTFPFTLYELFKFASRGLHPNEKNFIKNIVPTSFIFFIMGSIFAIYLIMPLFFKYILISADSIADSQISVQQSISIMVMLIAGIGLVFQIPVLMLFAIKMNIVQPNTLRKLRLVVYVSFITFLLFISPDPIFIAQLVCAILLVILFEFGLLLTKLVDIY